MLDTVRAILLFPYTSHGACTIDSINHLQSDVVNFAFTKDEKNIYTNAIVTIKVLDFRFGEFFFFFKYSTGVFTGPEIYVLVTNSFRKNPKVSFTPSDRKASFPSPTGTKSKMI
jgi:hypothetical protein